MDATKGSVELTLTDRIWDMILEIVREIAECFNLEDEQILDMLMNRTDKLSHFIEIYQLKLASQELAKLELDNNSTASSGLVSAVQWASTYFPNKHV